MTETISRIRTFISENFLFEADDGSLGNDDSFLDGGIIDSTGALEVVSWIEDTFGFEVDDEEFTPENFDSVNRLARYIEGKTSAA